MQTVIMGAEALAAARSDLVVAGGMESMTNAPTCSRSTARARASGTTPPTTTCALDGLEDAYQQGAAMGSFAQCTADEYQLSRQDMDDYAIESLARANAAIAGRRSPTRSPR
jgi:acetyl-CoA C-acetyltransferase